MKKKNSIKILGRTRKKIEFFVEDANLINYEQIDRLVISFMLKNNLKDLPIDVIELAKANDWMVIPYSKIPNKLCGLFEDIMYTDLGFTTCYKNNYLIFYNDNIDVLTQRFTIAHEIGHIALEHFISSDPTIREKEANTFAAKMLMPLGVIKACGVKSIYEIEYLCGVNYSIAKQRYKYLSKGKIQNGKELNIQFKNFIEKHKIRHNSA